MQRLITLMMATALFYGCGDSKTVREDSAAVSTSDTTLKADTSSAVAPLIACAGNANIYIGETLAKQMAKNFDELYAKRITTRNFQLQEMVERNVIEGFHSTISGAGYDGVRIYYGTKRGNDNTSCFLLVPTRQGTKHPNAWGNLVTVAGSAVFQNFNLEEGEGRRRVEKYVKDFRGQSNNDHNSAANKGLSSGVWVNKCVFSIMNSFLSSHQDYRGFKIYAAAYPTGYPYPPNGHHTDQESTIFFVPIKPDGQEDWVSLTAEKSIDKDKVWADALNHGQLCPTICPD
jgi:hypothetical protein